MAQIFGGMLYRRSHTPFMMQSLCFMFSTSPAPLEGSLANPKISSAVSVLTHQRSKSRWSHLRALFSDGFSSDEFSQVVFLIRNNAHLSLRFFDFTKRQSLCRHNLESYASLIHVLSRARLKGHACLIIKEAMRASPVSEPVRVFEVLAKTYRKFDSAPFVFDLLIESCLDMKKIDGAIEIARLLMSRAISPNVRTCNSLIRCVSSSRGALAGYDIYKELFRLGHAETTGIVKRVGRVLPNVRTFDTLMMSFYRDGASDRVLELWNEMQDYSCAPNACSYSILMTVYCEGGNMVEADRVWNKMKMDGVEADVMAYNTIIGGLCNAGDVEKAEEFFAEMESSGVECTSITFEHLIGRYCKIGDVDSAMLLYKDVLRRKIMPSELTVDAIVKGLCQNGRVREALDIMRHAQGNLHFSPKVTGYEVLLKGLCGKGEMEEASKLQAEMVGKGFRPNNQVYYAFIDGYREYGNHEMAEKLQKEMQDVQLNESGETFGQ